MSTDGARAVGKTAFTGSRARGEVAAREGLQWHSGTPGGVCHVSAQGPPGRAAARLRESGDGGFRTSADGCQDGRCRCCGEGEVEMSVFPFGHDGSGREEEVTCIRSGAGDEGRAGAAHE